jgi:hypothetical protein
MIWQKKKGISNWSSMKPFKVANSKIKMNFNMIVILLFW